MPLLEQLKSYLSVTYEDEDTDNKLEGILKRAADSLSKYAGCELTFSTEEETAEKQLLFDCCRYIFSDSYDAFKVNFSAELISLRAKYALETEDGKSEI